MKLTVALSMKANEESELAKSAALPNEHTPLRPCPVCGKPAELEHLGDSYAVWCQDELCTTGEPCRTPKAACAAWNHQCDLSQEEKLSSHVGGHGLLHCPFCGDLPALVIHERASGAVTYNIQCENPDCLLSNHRMVNTPHFSSKEELTALWNQRASKASPVVRF